jgi:hypothetical protein
MSPSPSPFPPDIGDHVVYGCAGPRPSGVCFCLRLPYRDETVDPPSTGQFDHEWIVHRPELDDAERDGRVDEVLLRRRAREERLFLRKVERMLRRSRARLERIGVEFVLRPTEP